MRFNILCSYSSLGLSWQVRSSFRRRPTIPLPGKRRAAAPAAAPAAPAPVDPGPLHQWGTDFSFMFDGYIEKNFNNPPSGFNGLRNFDLRSDMPHVNMGMITIDHAPAPVGFHLDVGFGETFDVIHSGNRDPGRLEVLQAGLCQH